MAEISKIKLPDNVTYDIKDATARSSIPDVSGFITTETDPVFSASAAASINASDITNWNNKTSNVGTITGVSINSTSIATSGVANITSIPLSIISDASDLKAIEAISSNSGLLKKTAANTWSLDTNTYLTSETDPVFSASAAAGITSSDIESWNTAAAGGGTITGVTAGTGLSGGGTSGTVTLNHSNSITAGTVGTSSATSGSTLAVPYVTYDAQGHITVTGTHTHTVSGFLTEHQTIKQDGITGATITRYGASSTSASTAAKTVSVTSGTFTLGTGARVTVKFNNANTANSPTLNVNSTGAKNIYHNGSQITSGTNKALLAGTVDFVYDGTQWQLIGNYIDTQNAGTITGVSVNGTSVATSGVANITSVPLSIISDATDLKAIEALTGTSGLLKKTAANTWSLDTSSYITGIDSSMVTTALGYTPYDSTNPNGYTTNTGTVTKVTAGTGLKIGTASSGGDITTSGTINHINSVTAQTTQAVYPIKIDAQGHISAYGTAVTIVNTRGTAASGGTTLSVVNTGDMYTWNNKQDKATTLAGYGITDAKISNGTITLGSNTITPLTSETYQGTVTSVQVQATSPVQSSTSTAQSTTLSTTISLANGYGDTKNPYGTKTKNYVLAGPTTGSDAAPTFRALVAGDIPDLSGTYSTTDEKVKQESLNGTNNGRNIILTPSLGTTGTITNSVVYARYMTYNDYSQELTITKSSDSTKQVIVNAANVSIKDGTYSTAIRANTPTAYRNIYLPDNNGTFALTSDIPSNISSFTNDAGYISSSTTAKIFVQSSTPTGMSAGDIWIDTTGL